jgi:hypothetical protein
MGGPRPWRLVGWLTLLLLPALPMGAAGASGLTTIRGQVFDATSGVGLPAATVLVEETGTAAACDSAGAFTLGVSVPGPYTLIISRVGYRSVFHRIQVATAGNAPVPIGLSPEPVQLAQALVQADRASTAAGSSRPVRAFDLRVRPVGSARDVVQTVPGLFTARRAGGGGAEQIFLRGFDSSQGADLAVSVDGMPANLVSHGHGQGYVDLGFLIPDVIERVDVYKGPYYAEYGDLANAAQLVLKTRDALPENSVRVERGGLNTRRYTAMVQLPVRASQGAYLAGDIYATDGAFQQPQDLHRLALFAKVRRRLGDDAEVAVTAGASAGAWDGPGQVAARAVDTGRISAWGTMWQTEGGQTGRHYVSLQYSADGADGSQRLTAEAYVSDYQLKVYNNNTFFLQDPIFGDATEQSERRLLAGAQMRYRSPHRLGRLMAHTTAGLALRTDQIDAQMWQVVMRRRYWPLVDVGLQQSSLSVWSQEDIVLGPAWRAVLGVRGDWVTFDVDDRLEINLDKGILPLTEYLKEIRRRGGRGKIAHVPLVQPHVSGLAQASVLSPKFALVYAPGPALEVFGDLGTGFHTNDARSVVMGEFVRQQARLLATQQKATEAEIAAVLDTLNLDLSQRDTQIVPRTVGGEIGVRWRLAGSAAGALRQWGPSAGHYPGDTRFHAPVTAPSGRLNLAAAWWWIDVDNEFIYVAETGAQGARGRTRRRGCDVEARAQVSSWLWADVDANWARGRQRDAAPGQNLIPLAPSFTSAGGLTARRGERQEYRVRYRHLGDRPATPDGSLVATGYSLVDLMAAYHLGRCQFDLAVDNVFDRHWREGQSVFQSVLPWEGQVVLHGPPPPADVNYSPGNPRCARLGLRVGF